MDYMYIYILDLFCLVMGVIGVKIPISAFIAFLVSITILWDIIASNMLNDTLLITLTVVTIVSTIMCGIIGWGKRD